MEFKGTKGKWCLKGRTNLSVHCIAVENGIELVYPIAKIDDFDKSSQQNKSNALLISKAPEILQELEFLLHSIDWSSEYWESEGTEHKTRIEKLIKEATTLNTNENGI